MLRALAFALFLVPAAALAQTAADGSSPEMSHDIMDHSKMHGQMTGPAPTEPGQSAFAAIQEIVGILEADPATDWESVNIDALREHLVDMDAVTLHAKVSSESIDGGIRFVITGDEPVRGSIRRMVVAHAATMDGVNAWRLTGVETEDGAVMTVTVPQAELEKLNALGFFGVLTVGMHHQEHHLMIARGGNPHH